MAYMGGLHFWWPKMTGRMYSQWWSRLAALIIFGRILFGRSCRSSSSATNGMPRRYYQYVSRVPGLETCFRRRGPRSWPSVYLLPLGYLFYSLRYGPRTGDNPWGATGLEWQNLVPRRRATNFCCDSDGLPQPLRIRHGGRPRMSLRDTLFTPAEQTALFDHTFLARGTPRRAVRVAAASKRNGRLRHVGVFWRPR